MTLRSMDPKKLGPNTGIPETDYLARPLNFCSSCHCEARSAVAISWIVDCLRDGYALAMTSRAFFKVSQFQKKE